jgi:hypothetical protein
MTVRSRAFRPAWLVCSVVVVMVATLFPRDLVRAQAPLTTECAFDSPTVYVTMREEDLVLSVGERDLILVNGRPCGGDAASQDTALPTTENADTVRVSGTGDVDDVTIDQTGIGAFPSGISFPIELGENEDTLHVDLTSEDDFVLGDAYSLYLYGDRSGGVQLGGVDLVEIHGGDGKDRIYAGDADGDVTGTLGMPDPGPLVPPITVWGGEGGDVLVGGAADDRLYGQAGVDYLEGQGGEHDVLIGGDGEDQCRFPDDQVRDCDPQVFIDPREGSAEESARVTGTGWYPENGAVSVRFGAIELPGLGKDLDPGGAFEGEFVVPQGEGTTVVSACQRCFDDVKNDDSATFEYASELGGTLRLNPKLVTEQQHVSVQGSAWTAGEEVQIFIDRVTLDEPFARGIPGEDGSFTVPVDAQGLALGIHDLIACQRCERGPREQRVFEVVPMPTIGVDPPKATADEAFEILGTGWQPRIGDVSISVSGLDLPWEPFTIPVRTGGVFEKGLDLSDVAPGSYTVDACQRCESPQPIEVATELSILRAPPDPPAPWWRDVARRIVPEGVLVILLAAGAYFIWRRIKPWPPEGHVIKARVVPRAMQVSVEVVHDGSSDHVVRLVPRRDLGVQRTEEVSVR